MRLLCPHCRSEIQVADHLAGQVQPCPRCQKLFRVPVPPPSTGVTTPSVSAPTLPSPATAPGKTDSTTAAGPFSPIGGSVPASEGPAGAGAAQTLYPTPPASAFPGLSPSPSVTAPAPSPPITIAPFQQPPVSLPQPVPSPGYTSSVVVLVVRPLTVQIVQLLAVLALAVLLFCPWIKIPPKTGVLLRQNGFQVAFGRAEGAWLDRELSDQDTKSTQEVSPIIRTSPLAILYFFLVLWSSLLATMLVAATVLDWPEIRPYLRFRSLFMGGLGLLAVLMLYLQLLVGFPAVDTWTNLRKPSADALKKTAEILQTDKADWLTPVIQSVADAPGVYVPWAWGLRLSLVATLVLVLVVLLDFWLQRRAQLLPPRLLLEK